MSRLSTEEGLEVTSCLSSVGFDSPATGTQMIQGFLLFLPSPSLSSDSWTVRAFLAKSKMKKTGRSEKWASVSGPAPRADTQTPMAQRG